MGLGDSLRRRQVSLIINMDDEEFQIQIARELAMSLLKLDGKNVPYVSK